ncbi:MAG: hypothetical protein WDK95_15810 [Syntrophorhabdaceae bacterium]
MIETALAPLKEPRYSVWQKNLMRGCDRTKLIMGHIRRYLIVIIGFFFPLHRIF